MQNDDERQDGTSYEAGRVNAPTVEQVQVFAVPLFYIFAPPLFTLLGDNMQ